MYLHIHQRAVLGGPCLLQDLKDGHCALTHNVHLTSANLQPCQLKSSCQQLLLGPLRVIIGIVLRGNKHINVNRFWPQVVSY